MTHIILVHGHRSSAQSPSIIALQNELEALGYSVSSFSLERPTLPDGSYKIVTVTEEVRQVEAFLVAKRKKHKRIIVAGHSQGGMAVAHLAAKGSIDAGVSLMGVVDPQWHTEKRLKRFGTAIEALDESWTHVTIHPREGCPMTYTTQWIYDYDSHNIAELLSRSKCPLLFVAGEEDEDVPLWEVEKGFEAAAEPKALVVMEGCGHTMAEPDGVAADIAQTINLWEDSL